MRNEKTYNGSLMEKGTENEEVILKWLKIYAKDIIDFREFRLAQRIDVDFGIETLDGNIVLAEIKSDKWIKEDGNLCFENHRINHFVKDKWFYLGWGWRSPAQKLIVRNPKDNIIFVFDFAELKKSIGRWVAENSPDLKLIPTDNQKTTYVYLVPMKELKGKYKKFLIEQKKEGRLTNLYRGL